MLPALSAVASGVAPPLPGSSIGWVHRQARQTYRSLKRRSVEQSAEVLPEAVDPRTTSVIAGSRLDLLEALEQLESHHPQLVQPLVLRDLGALTYAEIPFLQIWDEQVLTGELDKFDWLHLHHEDFTGQYGKFYFSFRSADWYREQGWLG